jgi:hypothetical protein
MSAIQNFKIDYDSSDEDHSDADQLLDLFANQEKLRSNIFNNGDNLFNYKNNVTNDSETYSDKNDSDSETIISVESTIKRSYKYNQNIKKYIIAYKNKVVMLKEFKFNVLPLNYFLIGTVQKEKDIMINQICQNYFLNGSKQNISRIKFEDDETAIKNIINKQENKLTSLAHIVIFDECFVNFNSLSNKKKCILYELFIRHRELNIVIILQTSEECYEQLMSKSMQSFINESIDHIFLCSEENKKNKIMIYNLYGNMYSSFDEYDEIYTQIIQSGSNMIISKNDQKLSYIELTAFNVVSSDFVEFDNIDN